MNTYSMGRAPPSAERWKGSTDRSRSTCSRAACAGGATGQYREAPMPRSATQHTENSTSGKCPAKAARIIRLLPHHVRLKLAPAEIADVVLRVVGARIGGMAGPG